MGSQNEGTNKRVKSNMIESLSEDPPVVIEIVDTREKLEEFLEAIESGIGAGLVTLEKAQIHVYGASHK
jgi:PII-like signaling protein